MSAEGGKDLLLKKEDPGNLGTFITVAGLRSKSISINNEAIDVTEHASNQFREILDECGIRSFSMSGSGVWTNAATLKEAITDALAGTLIKYQIVDTFTGGLTFEGLFKMTSLERAGEYNAEQTFSLSLESSGEITVT